MKVGMSTSSFFGRLKTEEALAAMGKMGVKVCEVFFDSFSEYEESFALQLKEIATRYDMEIYSIHAMGTQFEPQLFSINERQKEDAFQILRKVLHAGKILGAQSYTFHGLMNLKRTYFRRNYDSLAAKTRKIAALCREFGIRLAWENVHWCTYAAPGFAREMMRRMEDQELYFTLDVKQAAFSGFPVEAYLEDMDGRLSNIHLCDYVVENGGARPVLPGNGLFDFPAFAQMLEYSSYKGPAILEVYQESYGDYGELQRCFQTIAELLG